jgi:hypothetical protein
MEKRVDGFGHLPKKVLIRRRKGLRMPSHCLYCGLDETGKQKFHKDAKAKRKVNIEVGFDEWKATIGAKAEAIFAALFDLKIDLGIYPHGDDGVDFWLHGTPVDVKGTTLREPQPIRYSISENVLYVFIQVDGDHAYFQGFAFGGDDWRPCQTGYLPPKFGRWEEFKELVLDLAAKSRAFLDSL